MADVTTPVAFAAETLTSPEFSYTADREILVNMLVFTERRLPMSSSGLGQPERTPMTSVFRSLLVLVAAGSFVACSGEVRSPDFTPQLDRITVSPTPLSIAEGTTRQLTATGFYTTPPADGNTFTQIDITGQVSWSSADTSFVAVSAAGLVSGESVTSSAIDVTATLDGKSGVARVSVVAGVISSVTVYSTGNCTGPTARSEISQDGSGQLSAEARFEDPTTGNPLPALTQCLRSEVSWVSADPSTVCVETEDSPTLCPGLDTAGRDPIPGRIWGEAFEDQGVSVTATFTQDSGASASDAIPVFVTDAVLQSITLCPDVGAPSTCLAGVNTARGTTVPFRVYGLFSDGLCRDVTGLAGDPPSSLRGNPQVEVAPVNATAVLEVGGYKQAAGVPVTVAPASADATAEAGQPISFDASQAVDAAFCQDPGTFTPDNEAEAFVNIEATVPGQASLTALSTVAVLPTEVAGIYVCPEDRLNENSCVRCPGTAATDDQATRDACYIGTTDTPVQVGEGLQRDFLAFGMISDGSFQDFTSSPELTWLVRAEEDQTIPNTADLANIENGDDVDGDGDTTEGRLTLTDNATDVCSDVGVSPCDIIVGAQYQVTQDIVFADALTATILGVQPTNIVVTADPEDGCMASGLGGALPIGIPGLLETTTVQLSAAVSIVLLDETDQPVPGSEFIESNFPVNWDDPIEGTWDNANDVCVEGGTGFGPPVTVTSDGLVEPNPLVTGQACVTGSIRDGMGAVIDPPGDDTDPLLDGGTVTVDTVAALALACDQMGGFDSDEPSP